MSTNPTNIPCIRNWIINSSRTSIYVTFDSIQGDLKKKQAFQKQKKKYLLQLKNTLSRLNNMKQETIRNLAKITDTPFIRVSALCFDDQRQNLNLRKLVFLHYKIQREDLKLNNLEVEIYLAKIEECNNLIQLLTEILPDNVSCKINDEFFIVKLSRKIEKLTFQLSSLRTYFSTLKEEIKSYQKPVWFTDFSAFLHDNLTKSVLHIDEELSYVPPLPFEEQVSRYCFCSNSNPIGNKIDELINCIFDEPPNDFLQLVLDLSVSLLPNTENYTEAQKAVSMTLFFRIIFDRLYELFPDFMFPSDGKGWIKMSQLASLPCCAFNLPKDSSPQHNDNESIREVFRRDQYYRSAAQFLENTVYSTNPIDCLYFIHKTLLSINKAALMNRMKEKEASFNDLQQLLCFDDLFALFMGVYLSSDNYDFLCIADFVTRFSPAFCLSNSFEYAQASLESLVKHLSRLDPKEMLEKTKK